MTDDKLYTSFSANTIMAKLTNHVQRTRFITSSTDKHYSLDSEDDFRSGCRNVSHQQQFFSELHSPGRSHYTNMDFILVKTKLGYKKIIREYGLVRDFNFIRLHEVSQSVFTSEYFLVIMILSLLVTLWHLQI